METQTATTKRGAQKDVQAILTEKVIEKLKNGIVPWRVPWIEAGIPENLISHNAYKGINRILLASLGCGRNIFITEKQLGEIGGTLIPGERPHLLGYLDNGKKKGEASDTPIPPDAGGAKEPMTL